MTKSFQNHLYIQKIFKIWLKSKLCKFQWKVFENFSVWNWWVACCANSMRICFSTWIWTMNLTCICFKWIQTYDLLREPTSVRLFTDTILKTIYLGRTCLESSLGYARSRDKVDWRIGFGWNDELIRFVKDEVKKSWTDLASLWTFNEIKVAPLLKITC